MGNHNSGRRPQPTALKVLRGNPGKRKLNEAEPKPPAGEIAKPARLSGGAGEVWDELAPIAMAMGTLTTADVSAFATLCELRSTFDMAAWEKGREGFSPFSQSMEQHPAIKLERDTAAALRPYYEKFGLEPVGRARISVPAVEVPVSKWAGVLNA